MAQRLKSTLILYLEIFYIDGILRYYIIDYLYKFEHIS